MTAKRAKTLEPIPLWVSDGHILPEPWRREPIRETDMQPLREVDCMPVFGNALGDHMLCGGAVIWHQTAVNYATITCAKCHMRFSVPLTVKTWADLRAYCTKTFGVTP